MRYLIEVREERGRPTHGAQNKDLYGLITIRPKVRRCIKFGDRLILLMDYLICWSAVPCSSKVWHVYRTHIHASLLKPAHMFLLSGRLMFMVWINITGWD